MFSRRNESLERHRIAQRWKILYIILLLVIIVVHICLMVLYILYRISEDNQYWVSFIILQIISIYFCNFFLCRFIYKVTDIRPIFVVLLFCFNCDTLSLVILPLSVHVHSRTRHIWTLSTRS